MNDAPSEPQRDYRDTVFLPQTGFPMRGDLPRKEPQILARWEQMDLWSRLRAASRGPAEIHPARRTALRERQHPHRHRAEQDPQGRHQPHAPDGRLRRRLHPWLGLPRPADRMEDRGGVPRQKEEQGRGSGAAIPRRVSRLRRTLAGGADGGVPPPRRRRRLARALRHDGPPSEAAIASEICKFLLNGALYRGLRPVLWSPVEKTALAEAEVEYHDHTSTTIWVRFPVAPGHRAAGDSGASLVIWTTTPWTIPGNRAIAAGAEFDYALVHVDGVAETRLARVGEKLVVALELLPQFLKDVGIATHHIVHVFRGADLAGTVCAHPLRGRGYDFAVPVFLGDFVTIEAGTGLVHIAPNAGEDDFVLGRQHGLEVADTRGRRRHLQRMGATVRRRACLQG